MGQAKQRRQRFLTAHPWCCFCGGGNPSDGPDHVPPRQLFYRRMSPEGFEVPACIACNGASRRDEMVIGYYARLQRDDPPGETNPHLDLLIGLRNNVPEALPKPLTTTQKRRALRHAPFELGGGQTFAELPVVGVPPAAIHAFERYVCKATCAIIYREAGIIPPKTALFWGFARPSSVLRPERLHAIMPFKFENRVWPTVQRRSVADVFSYTWTLAADRTCFSASYEFGTAFTALGFSVFSMADVKDDETDWCDALGVPYLSTRTNDGRGPEGTQ